MTWFQQLGILAALEAEQNKRRSWFQRMVSLWFKITCRNCGFERWGWQRCPCRKAERREDAPK